jgi:hypothetical protein
MNLTHVAHEMEQHCHMQLEGCIQWLEMLLRTHILDTSQASRSFFYDFKFRIKIGERG